MATDILLLVAGCALLYLGGDWLVDGVRAAAVRLCISPVIVAFVVMGFGTSAPELFVAVSASLADRPAIALGNVVGSNVANLFLVLGLTALLAPLQIDRNILRIDGTAMLAATLAFVAVALDGTISRMDAALLIGAMVIYVGLRWHTCDPCEEENTDTGLAWAVTLMLAGLAALPLGAHLFVDGAVHIASALGVSQALIGMTVVAVGTSLPELAACLIAAAKKRSDMVLGGILGSNVFNSSVVIGGAAMAAPLAVGSVFLVWWMPVMVALSLTAMVFLRTGYVLDRREGALMLAAYVAMFVL